MKRNLQLDFLRFCGIILVMVHHIPTANATFIGRFLNYIKPGGWIGVDLFFVLSGFLVSGLIIKEYQRFGSFDAKRFLIRRGFKIYPAFYIYLIYQFLFNKYLTNHPQSISGLISEGLFVSNYFGHNNNHLWSICVEEHFYFLLSLLFVVLIKIKSVDLRVIVWVYFSLFILGIGCRYYNFISFQDYDFSRDYARSHIRFDGLFFGVLIAYVSNYRQDIIRRITSGSINIYFMILAILFLSTNFIFEREKFHMIAVVNLALNPICFGYLLINIINFKSEKFLKIISPLSYIGMYSYSIYLFHEHFIQICNKVLGPDHETFYILYFIVALTGGIVISKCIEYPIIKIRERYFPSKSGVLKLV